MTKVEQLRKDRPKFLEELKKSAQGSGCGQEKPILYFTAITVICLIGATIPHMATFKPFGQSAFFCLILLSITIVTNRKQLRGKQIKRTAAIICLTMFLTGCSGFFVPDFGKSTPLLEYLHEADKEYKTGHAGGMALFGFGLDDATVETAMTNDNITKAYSIETSSSYGWIAVARVKVYGK